MDSKITIETIEDLVKFKLLDCKYSPRFAAINKNGQIWLFSGRPYQDVDITAVDEWGLIDFDNITLDCPLPTTIEDGDYIDLPEHINWRDCCFEL